MWAFINHEPEEDENSQHKHLVLKLNKVYDTMNLNEFLVEPCPYDPRPFRCMDFHKTKSTEGCYIDDWILYEMHDPEYLAWKGQSRKYQYSFDDFVSDDLFNLKELYNHAYKASEFAVRRNLLRKLQDVDFNPAELIETGQVPLQQAGALNAYDFMRRTHRGARGKTHD